MSGFLPQLAFLAAGGSQAPPLLLLTILFLDSQSPLPNTTALALAYFATCTAMGIVGLTAFGGTAGAGGVASVGSRAISATVGGLLIPDAQPPRWMESISSMSPPRAFGYIMALFPIKNLAIFVPGSGRRGKPRTSSQRPGARADALRLRHTGPWAHRHLRSHATTCLDNAWVLAGMDAEQLRGHGRALLRIRSVLPDQRPLGTLRP